MPTYQNANWSTSFKSNEINQTYNDFSGSMTRGRGQLGVAGMLLSGTLYGMALADFSPNATSSVRYAVASGLTAATYTGTRSCTGKNGWAAIGILIGTTFRTYKQSAYATFAAKGTITVASVQSQGSLLYDSASDTYHYINVRVNGSSKDEVVHWSSTDDMANWTEVHNPDLYTPGSEMKCYEGNGVNACLDDSGNIHVVVSAVAGDAKQSLHYLKWTKATDSWSSPVTIENTAQSDTGATKYHHVRPQIVYTPDGYLHVLSHRRTATNNSYLPHYYTNRTGSWSAATLIGGEYAGQRIGGLMPRSDSTVCVVIIGLGYSPNTANSQLVRYEISALGVVGTVENIDTQNFISNNLALPRTYAEAPEAGVICWAGLSGNSNYLFQSSDLTWRVEDPKVTSVTGSAFYSQAGQSTTDSTYITKHRPGLTRASDGRMWVIYDGGPSAAKRYIYAKYSDDDGATWSAEETVYDRGSEGTYPHWSDIVLDGNEDPVVLIHELNSATIRIYRRESSVWTAKTSITTPSTLQSGCPRLSYNRTQGKLHVCNFRYIATASVFHHWESADNGATWSTVDTSAGFGGTSVGNNAELSQGYDAYMDDTGVHHFAAAGPATTTNYASVYYATRDTSGVWSTPVLVYTYTGTGDISGLTICHDGVIPRIFAGMNLGSFKIPYLFAQDPSGGWGIFLTPSSGAGTKVPFQVLRADGSVFCMANTGSTFNVASWIFRQGRMVWDHVSVELVANAAMGTDRGAIGFTSQSMLGDAVRFRDGVIFFAPNNADNNLAMYKSTSITWGGLTQSYTKSVDQSLNLQSIVTAPIGNAFLVDSSATGRIVLGGRQMRRIGERIWCFGNDGSVTHAYYSDDSGVTWTREQVAGFYASAISSCQGADGQPVVLLTKETGSYEIRTFKRETTGGWTHKADLGTGDLEDCGGHQILYDGSYYYAVYSRINPSNGKRQIRFAYSANLGSWTASTLFADLVTGDDAGYFRGLAACLDSAGDMHLIFREDRSLDSLLYYMKRTSGTWGSAELIETVANVTHSGLSITTDKNNKPHIMGHRSYAGTDKIFYRSKTGSSWSTEEFPFGDEECRWPSIGLQDRQYPTVVSSLTGFGGSTYPTFSEKRADGNWSSVTLGGVGAGAEQVYDGYRNASITLEGFFCAYLGSINVFVTSQIVWGDSPASSGDASFSQNIKLYARDRVNHTLTMASVLSDPNWGWVQSADSSLPMSHVVAFTRDRPRSFEPRTVVLTDDVTYRYTPVSGNDVVNVAITQYVQLEGLPVGLRSRDKVVTHTINLSQTGPGLVWTAEVTSELELSHVRAFNIFKKQFVTQSLLMAQSIVANWNLNKTVAQTLNMIQGLVRVRSWVWNSTHYNPGWAAEYEGDVSDFIIMGPASAPTIAMTLPKPDFDDQDVLFRRDGAVRRNRTSQARTFRTPIYNRYKFEWSGLLRKRADEFKTLIKTLLGKQVRIRDHNGTWKTCIITNTEIAAIQTGPEFVNVMIEMEETTSVA